MANTDDLTRDQKVDFVLAVHELGRLAEEWARSTTPLTDKELNRFQELCGDLGVSESSLLTRYQRLAREDAFKRAYPLTETPQALVDLGAKRQPGRVPPPMTAHDRWKLEQADRDLAYGSDQNHRDDPGMEGLPPVASLSDLQKTLPPISQSEKFDNANHIDPEGDMLVPQTPTSTVGAIVDSKVKRNSRGNPVPPPPSSKVERPVPASKAKVVSAVPSDPHGKIKMAPPEIDAEKTGYISHQPLKEK